MRADGQRGLKTPRAGAWTPLCVSNPQLQRCIVDEAWDGGDVLTLGEADAAGESMCHCPQCLAWDGPQPTDFPEDFRLLKYTPHAMGDRYARYWKAVYDLAVKRNPQRQGGRLSVSQHPARSDHRHQAESKHLRRVRHLWISGWLVSDEPGRRPVVSRPVAGLGKDRDVARLRAQLFIEQLRDAQHHHPADRANSSSSRTSMAWSAPTFAATRSVGRRMVRWPTCTTACCGVRELEIETIRQEYFSAFGPAAAEVEQYFDYWENYARTRPPVRDISTDPKGALERLKRIRGHYLAYPPQVYRSGGSDPGEGPRSRAKKDPLPEFAQRVEFLQAGLKHALLSTRLQEFLDFESPGAERGSAPTDPTKLKQARQAMRELIQFRQDPRNHVRVRLHQQRDGREKSDRQYRDSVRRQGRTLRSHSSRTMPIESSGRWVPARATLNPFLPTPCGSCPWLRSIPSSAA